ncbi:VWA domain-containing protein, partial [Bacteriovoracaceae bacterium]|nr:VWA domain-containing protein [Bacteriovoracaceae bacterium]
ESNREYTKSKEKEKRYFSQDFSEADIFENYPTLKNLVNDLKMETLYVRDVLDFTNELSDDDFQILLSALIEVAQLTNEHIFYTPIINDIGEPSNVIFEFYKHKNARLINSILLAKYTQLENLNFNHIRRNYMDYFSTVGGTISFSDPSWTVSFDRYFGFEQCLATKDVTLRNPIQPNYVLFVLDNSGSMSSYQRSLKKQTSHFLSELNKILKKGSFYVGISTSDNRTVLPFKLIQSDTDIQSVKRKMRVGTDSYSDEYLYSSMNSYLERHKVGKRSNLLYVGLSDEPEQSVRNKKYESWFNAFFNRHNLLDGRFLGYNLVKKRDYRELAELPYFKNYKIRGQANLSEAIDHINKNILVDYQFIIDDEDIFGATGVEYTDYNGNIHKLESHEWKMVKNTGYVTIYNIPNYIKEVTVEYKVLCSSLED